MRRLLLLVVLVALRPAGAQTAAAARALAAGDSSAAYAAVRDGLRASPGDADLHRLRLALELDGVGTRGVPRVARHRQLLDTARALRRLAPADTLALRVLVDDALWDVLSTHDLVTPTSTRSAISGAEFVSRAEIEARLGASRFDVDARRRLADDLDASGPARQARATLPDLLAAWRRAAPADLRPHTAALTLALVDADTSGALAAAEGARAARPDHPNAALYVGLAEARFGDAARAEAAFAEAFTALGPDRAARYERLDALLTPDQQAAYAASPDSFATAYWDARDPRRLTAANERRAEHAARVVEADLLFGRALDDLFRPAPDPPRGAETPQGRIWVRYGRPDRTTRFSPNADGVQAYGDTRFAVWDYADFRVVFDDPDRDGGYRTYSPPAGAMRSLRAVADDYVLQDRRLQRENPAATSVAPTLDVPLVASRFRRADGRTEVIVAYGLPVPARAADALAAAVFRLRDGRVAATVPASTLGLAPARALADGGAPVWPLVATLTLDAPGAEVRAEVAVGTAWGAATVALDPLPVAGFGVSDLLLAASVDEAPAEARGTVERGGVRVRPVPRAVFPAGAPVVVVVEAYGLARRGGGTDAEVEASLTPVDARRGLGRLFGRRRAGGVSTSTRTQGDTPTETFVFSLDTAGQQAGRYTLAVSVTDRATGATAATTREVTLE